MPDRCLGLTSHPRSFDLLAGFDSLSFQRSPDPASCGRSVERPI